MGSLPMLYQTYQMQDDLVAPFGLCARTMMSAAGAAFWGLGESVGPAARGRLEMISRFELTHTRPDFGIAAVRLATATCR